MREYAILLTTAIILILAANAGTVSCPGAALAPEGGVMATVPSARGDGGLSGGGFQAYGGEQGKRSDDAPVQSDIEMAIGVLDGDSALAALPLVALRSPDRKLAGEALARAGFLAYVRGDFEQAEAFFAAAADKRAPDALLWQGLALLADGQIDDAARVLRRAEDSGGDPSAIAAASLGLAACDLASGRAHDAAERCNDILQRDVEGSAGAALLLQRCLLREGEGAVSSPSLEHLGQRYPMAYETAAIQSIQKAAAREVEPPKLADSEDVSIDQESGEVAQPPSVEGGPGVAGSPNAQEGFSPQGGSSVGGGSPVPGEGIPEEGAPEEVAPQEGAAVQEGFTVQVGAFSEARNAEALASRLAQQGYDSARIESEMKQGTLFHCVRVGRFSARADAAALASILEEKEGLGTQILKTIIDPTQSAD